MKTFIRYTALALILLVLPTVFALAQTGGAYGLGWHTIDSGGGQVNGGTFTLDGTVGQPDVASMNGGTFSLSGGFRYSNSSQKYIYLPLVLK